MSGIDLALLGIKKEELQDRVIERICEKVLTGVSYDEDGDIDHVDSSFKRKLDERITKHINGAVEKLADENVKPGINALIENVCLQETNRYGEPRGEKKTFIEYLTVRAEAYFTEPVDSSGKSKDEAGGYSWSQSTTRGMHMIRQHLNYSIETVMKKALQNANSQIASGIEAAIKFELDNILKKIRVTAEVR